MKTLTMIAFAVTATLTAAAAQTPDGFTPAMYLNYETVAAPALSPDGRQIVYTRRWINTLEDRWDAALWIMNADGSRNRFFAEGSSPVWSPDGSRIAYMARGEPQGTQIFVRYVDGEGPPTQITREAFTPGNVQWSPDSRWLGFVRFVPVPNTWSVDMPSGPQGAKWTPAPRHIDRLHWRQDRIGLTDPGETHLFVVPADGGTARQLTEKGWSAGARFDGLGFGAGWSWSPDGTTIVVEGFPTAESNLNYRDAHLYAVTVATGERRQLTSTPGSWSAPKYSPDGRTIAYVGHEKVLQTYRVADLYLMNADGSNPRLLTPGLDREPGQLEWAPDGRSIYFAAEDEGSINLFNATTDARGARPVTNGAHVLSLGNLYGNTAVAVRSHASKPGDVVTINLRRPAEITQLTNVNDDILTGARLAEVEEIWYRSTNDTRVQGWIVKPPGFDPSQRYPLLLEIHGGPHGMYNVGFNWFFQMLAAKGYVVLYTNPRGSTGYGTAFGNAIDRAYPSVDYDDLMAGVDSVVARGYVDQQRMYVAGCSGGGVLSSWVIGHTDRFAGAAVRCPVTNWMSFAGVSDVPLFTHNFFDRPFWEDPQAWLRQSPLMYVGNVKTPTVLMTGVLDLRTPISQTDEYFAALQMRGIPSAILRFEGEYHGTTTKPSNAVRTVLYMDDWFRKHAPSTP